MKDNIVINSHKILLFVGGGAKQQLKDGEQMPTWLDIQVPSQSSGQSMALKADI
jgi:hypothetical protein